LIPGGKFKEWLILTAKQREKFHLNCNILVFYDLLIDLENPNQAIARLEKFYNQN